MRKCWSASFNTTARYYVEQRGAKDLMLLQKKSGHSEIKSINIWWLVSHWNDRKSASSIYFHFPISKVVVSGKT